MFSAVDTVTKIRVSAPAPYKNPTVIQALVSSLVIPHVAKKIVALKGFAQKEALTTMANLLTSVIYPTAVILYLDTGPRFKNMETTTIPNETRPYDIKGWKFLCHIFSLHTRKKHQKKGKIAQKLGFVGLFQFFGGFLFPYFLGRPKSAFFLFLRYFPF